MQRKSKAKKAAVEGDQDLQVAEDAGEASATDGAAGTTEPAPKASLFCGATCNFLLTRR